MSFDTFDPRSVDLMALIGTDTALRFEARTRGGEYAGPCPWCGGKDRFRVQPREGKWHCRKCTEHWGDCVDYVCKRDRCSKGEALRTLQGVPTMAYKVPEKPSVTDAQRATFHAIATACHANLLAAPRPLAYLATRGITLEDCVTWQLGYSPARHDTTAPVAGCRVVGGITIPLWGIDGLLYGISTRRASTHGEHGELPKYQAFGGSTIPLYGKPAHGYGRLLVVEGWFDCILATRLLGEMVDVVARGTAKGLPSDHWRDRLNSYGPWLVCMDTDLNQTGQEAAEQWRAASGRTVVLRTPGGHKDLTDAWQAGADLPSWMAGILTPAAHTQPTPPLVAASHVCDDCGASAIHPVGEAGTLWACDAHVAGARRDYARSRAVYEHDVLAILAERDITCDCGVEGEYEQRDGVWVCTTHAKVGVLV